MTGDIDDLSRLSVNEHFYGLWTLPFVVDRLGSWWSKGRIVPGLGKVFLSASIKKGGIRNISSLGVLSSCVDGGHVAFYAVCFFNSRREFQGEESDSAVGIYEGRCATGSRRSRATSMATLKRIIVFGKSDLMLSSHPGRVLNTTFEPPHGEVGSRGHANLFIELRFGNKAFYLIFNEAIVAGE